jgi:putative addiction module killer protein
MFEVIQYETEGGEDLFARWLANLHDRQAVARVVARIVRLELGLFGDCKPLDAGVWELRVDWGPG